jgi:hypothetical protein
LAGDWSPFLCQKKSREGTSLLEVKNLRGLYFLLPLRDKAKRCFGSDEPYGLMLYRTHKASGFSRQSKNRINSFYYRLVKVFITIIVIIV